MTPDELRAAAERLLKSAQVSGKGQPWDTGLAYNCLLYTSDAADDTR